ncbi:MAG: polysaccharide biosynthesis protein [Sphingobacteriaceae bacterium]|nr:MAG: polysaccharide biosynthesis protein [Sphingobacteriaceae bacterium]
MSTAKKFAGQTAIYGLTTVLPRILSFFLTPVYVKAFSTSKYGILNTMFNWTSLLNPLLAFGMETTFFRYLNKHPEKKQTVYDNAFGMIILMTILFLLCTLPWLNSLADYIKIDEDTSQAEYALYIKCFIAILAIDAICVVPFAKIRGEGRPGRYGVIKTINILAFIVLNLFFIFVIPFIITGQYPGAEWLAGWYRPNWLGYVFISNLAASGLTLLLLIPELAQIRLKIDRPLLLEMLSYSWPVLIANFSFIINENLDKLLLGKLLPLKQSSEQVGIYTACTKLAVFLNIFIQAFRLGAEPFFFSSAQHKNSGQIYARIMNIFVVAICMIFIALVANIEIIKYFIKASNPIQKAMYWSGLRTVPILLFGYLSLGVYMNLSVWYKLSDQTRYGLYISGIGALLTIILNVIFIPMYGYMAAAWISLAAYTTMAILSYLWGQKNYPIPYNIKKNLAYIVSSTVIVYVSFVVFKRNIFIGNGLLIAYALTAFYFERKELLSIFKR